MFNTTRIILSLFLLSSATNVLADGSYDLPPLPTKSIPSKIVGAGAPSKSTASVYSGATKSSGAKEYAITDVPPLDVDVDNGSTKIIYVAKDMLNHLTVPFLDPQVQTANDASIKVKGTSLYVATSNKQPVGLHLTDPKSGVSFSLTLIPVSIPPRQVNIIISGTSSSSITMAKRTAQKSQKWEKSHANYIDTLLAIMSTLAHGKVPSGYIPDNNDDITYSHSMPSRDVDLHIARAYRGRAYKVIIFSVVNKGPTPKEIDESYFNDEGTLAVSAWPIVHLEPGEATEVFVVTNNKHQGQ